ncbi:MAG: sugar transferase [Ferruginibacter sp.]
MQTATTVEKNSITPDLSKSTQTQDNVFLFITSLELNTPEYYKHYNNSYIATGFAEAKEILLSLTLPELLIIDIPLNHFELVEFKVWLTSNELNNIPVIYNESALKNEDIKQLFKQKLVDDIVHLEKNYAKLPYKAKFIQKFNYNKSYKNNKSHGKVKGNRSSYIIRAFDILISSLAIILLLPVFIIIAIAVKIESKGPLFYSALRAGKGFKIFKFYKFRTMIADADKKISELSALNIYSNGTGKANFFKIKDDPRITRIGSFLRNSSLDELPQLFNVLKGDMSIVGNRPLPLYEATTLTTNEWAERFMAPAGITGLWQIKKRGQAEMSNEERILLDITYARNRSLKGDFKILIQTPTALMQKSNV